MKYCVLTGADAGTRAAEAEEVCWARIGKQTVLWAPDALWNRAGLDGRMESRESTGQLYLVIQVGATFERAHPEVKIVLNKGRHLVVDLTPGELPLVTQRCETCWTVRPLPAGAVIVDSLRISGRAPQPEIQTLVDAVSQTAFQASLTWLASLRTRHSLSTQFADAANWALGQFQGLGYQASLRSITVGSGTSLNVVADKAGQSSGPRDVILITAHLDSINQPGGAAAPAPGADDNGSGAAAVLEMARVLAAASTQHDLRCILFGGEEQGLHGSQQYVASLPAAERARIRAVVNMDMIATLNSASPTVLLEGATVSQGLMNQLAAAATTYTTLGVETSLHPFASDHVPFLNALMPAVLTIEGTDSANTNIHTAGDTLDHIHYPLAIDIMRMNVAVAAEALGVAAAGALASRTSGPVVSWGANRLDVFVIGTDRALYHKWWNGSAWGPSLTGYEAQGGIIPSNAEVASWGPNRLDVFVLGTDRALYHKWWNGSAWGPSLTGYERQGGVCVSRPRAVAWGPNRLDVFVTGTDSALYHKWWNGSAWGPSLTGFERQGGIIIGDPEVVSWGPNRLDVFVLGTDSAVYHKWWNGSAWGPSLTGYERQGGVCTTAPKAVCWGPNRIDLFVYGTDQALYHKAWNGSAWLPSLTGWERLGGVCTGEPAVVSWGPNRLDIFVLGTDLAVYHKWWNGSAWGPSVTGWERMGGVCMSPPRAVCWGPNRIDLFVVGTDRALYHKWWDGSNWGPSLTGWERQGGVITDF
jgi:Zn-dependent M28 family amino/carboxypeptidase